MDGYDRDLARKERKGVHTCPTEATSGSRIEPPIELPHPVRMRVLAP